jgi:hypothetical protein
MLPLLPALIGGGLSLVGGILGHKGKNKDAQSQWDTKRPQWEHDAAKQAARNQMVRGILKSYGADNVVDEDEWSKLQNPTPFPNAPQESWLTALGGTVSGVGGAMAGMGARNGQSGTMDLQPLDPPSEDVVAPPSGSSSEWSSAASPMMQQYYPEYIQGLDGNAQMSLADVEKALMGSGRDDDEEDGR